MTTRSFKRGERVGMLRNGGMFGTFFDYSGYVLAVHDDEHATVQFADGSEIVCLTDDAYMDSMESAYRLAAAILPAVEAEALSDLTMDDVRRLIEAAGIEPEVFGVMRARWILRHDRGGLDR